MKLLQVTFWADLLTKPPQSVPASQRRQARLVSTVLLFMLVMTLLEKLSIPSTPWVVIVALAIIYLLSRLRFYRWAAIFMVIALSIDPYYRQMTDPDIITELQLVRALAWNILPILLASLVFPLWGTALVCLGHALALPALLLIRPDFPANFLGTSLPFVISISAVILLVQHMRDLAERDRQAELRNSKILLEIAYDETLRGWSQALELRERETAGHSQRVVEATVALARVMGVAEEQIPDIRRGALLHDIGKMGIPDSVLLKPGPLTDAEWALMHQHTHYAVRFLADIPFLQPAMIIPCYHHERWDGSGYPYGLRGEAIPLPARIFAVVDVWDALSSERPYHPAWREADVREYLLTHSGTMFDPRVVETFLKLMDEGVISREGEHHLAAGVVGVR